MPANQPLRVLVVDDTALYRKIVRDLLAEHPSVEVVGAAANGRIALDLAEQTKPHLMTVDVEMPVMNGLEVLERLREQQSSIGAIMLSALTDAGADATINALTLGAFDFVLKPSTGGIDESVAELKKHLFPKIDAFIAANQSALSAPSDASTAPPRITESAPIAARRVVGHPRLGRPECVCIGISTGGPDALTRMLPSFAGDLNVPVFIVQHMPAKFTRSLADDLDRRCPLKVQEASDGQLVQPGHVYIAPGGSQMKVVSNGTMKQIAITSDPPIKNCRPSVDYLFRSIFEVYGNGALAMIMTGMGDDGADGCRLLHSQGATILAQDEASCVVFGMPRYPVIEGLADEVLPLNRLADAVNRRVKGKVAA